MTIRRINGRGAAVLLLAIAHLIHSGHGQPSTDGAHRQKYRYTAKCYEFFDIGHPAMKTAGNIAQHPIP